MGPAQASPIRSSRDRRGVALKRQIGVFAPSCPLSEPSNPVSFAPSERALSSAVEHHLDMVGVSGSIPLARTTF